MNAAPPLATAGRRRVALVGRANSGKTSLLMHLTGSLQRPVNFPGTSVECVEGDVRLGATTLCIVDLPGIASLEAHSRDEAEALRHLTDPAAAVDVLCVVLDASKLIVELRLLAELRRLGRPMLVALTKIDVATAEGFPVDIGRLQQALGVPLLVVNGASGAGIDALRQRLAGPLPDVLPPVERADRAAGAAARRAVARSRTDRIDAVLLHPLLGPIVLALVVLAMFQLVFAVAEPFMGWIEAAQGLLGAGIAALVPAGTLRSFLVDGLVNGVGSALVFVPQIALLIGFVTVVEASGYMARAVFLLDRLLRKVGLSGRSFVPLASSFACAIPGIVGSRILDDERDRLATIAVAPLMSCSARLPVYVVLLAAFFPPHQAGLLLFLLYLLGVVVAACVALLLKRTVLRGGVSMLAMELPVYERPRLRVVAAHTWHAVRSFLRMAGTVILFATVVVWALGYFPRPPAIHDRFEALRAETPAGDDGEAQRERLDAQEAAAYLEQSWLASIGRTVQPVFAPAGFDWRTTVGVLAAFPARELVVPTLGTLFSLGEVEPSPDVPDPRLTAALRAARDADGRRTMNGLVALALMVFFALCSQCAGTLAAIRRETHSWRWPVFTFAYMTVLAWAAAVAIYQVGSWLGYGPA
ncbi:MAG: ferrous iron transport protein B [Planctomycetes bacterium]|nr:ferrous iron transport protein B [Planctomycetota bacterium]